MQKPSSSNKSRSMLSLTRLSSAENYSKGLRQADFPSGNSKNVNRPGSKNSCSKRYSAYVGTEASVHLNALIDNNRLHEPKRGLIKSSATTGNIKQLDASFNLGNPIVASRQKPTPVVQHTTITKSCISNPCAFQHINSLKETDHKVRILIKGGSLSTLNDSSTLYEHSFKHPHPTAGIRKWIGSDRIGSGTKPIFITILESISIQKDRVVIDI